MADDDVSNSEAGGEWRQSPTPDRDSIQLEDDLEGSGSMDQPEITTEPTASRDKSKVDSRSVLAGGQMLGWTPDVALILWRRMLRSLGDVNKVEQPEVHAQMFECLHDLLTTLILVF